MITLTDRNMESNGPEFELMMAGSEPGENKSGDKKPGETPETLSAEEEAQAAHWLAVIEAEQAAKPPEPKKEEGEISMDLRAKLDIWLDPVILDSLNALTTEKEAMENALRKVAKEALIGIHAACVGAKRGSERYNAYVTLSQAVGMINSGKVDHTRTPGEEV